MNAPQVGKSDSSSKLRNHKKKATMPTTRLTVSGARCSTTSRIADDLCSRKQSRAEPVYVFISLFERKTRQRVELDIKALCG
jgi:hypothetical protein